jgi:hypothetical protein
MTTEELPHEVWKLPIWEDWKTPWSVEVVVDGKKILSASRQGIDWGERDSVNKRLAISLLVAIDEAVRSTFK